MTDTQPDPTPGLHAPAGACDCHMHVYDARFAVAPGATVPTQATAADYLQVRRALGLTRAVVVQPNAYRFDNACLVDAMATFGAGARGVATVPPDIADDELEQLHAQGVRGVRYHLLPGGPLSLDSLETMAARIAPLGWNINLQLDGHELPQHEAMLARLPCKLVIDHNGKFLEPVAPEHPGMQALLRLLDRGRSWVKLSAAYETSLEGPPHYGDVGLLAKRFVEAAPERCLWASNWPHPGKKVVPSNAAMLDLLLEWAPDDAVRTKILVDNPATVYGFADDERAWSRPMPVATRSRRSTFNLSGTAR